ncbi:Isochorismatase hydrolase [Nemania serpens]|nr:Isochorismatase hydrolase [Nemania serpens]
MPNGEPCEPSAYSPSQTALIFIDYSNAVVSYLANDSPLIPAAEKLLAAARKNKVAIVHCLEDLKSYPASTNKLFRNWNSNQPFISENSTLAAEYAAFAPDEQPSASYEKVYKRAPGRLSVLDDEVVKYLWDDLGVRHLILAGIGTSGAIMGTMSHGMDLDFVVSVVGDASWDESAEAHSVLMKSVIPKLAYVLSVRAAESYMTG